MPRSHPCSRARIPCDGIDRRRHREWHGVWAPRIAASLLPVLRNVYRLVSLQQQPSRLEYNGRLVSDTQWADGESEAMLFVGGLDEFRETHFPVRDRPAGPDTASQADRVQGR